MRIPSFLLALSISTVATAATPPAVADDLLRYVPDQALAAVVLHKAALRLPIDYLAHDPALKSDLAAFLGRTVGVDLTDIVGAVAFANRGTGQKPTPAVVLQLASTVGPLKGAARGDHGGVPLVALDASGSLVAAATGQMVVLGDEVEVRLALDVIARRVPGLQSTSPLGFLVAVDRNTDLSAGIDLDHALDGTPAAAMAGMYGLHRVTLTVGRTGLVELALAGNSGDGAKLGTLQNTLNMVMSQQLGQLKADSETASRGDDMGRGLLAIFTFRSSAHLWAEVAPVVAGDRLVSHYQIPELKGSGMLVPVLGIVAAVAVPAFEKYMMRAKEAEGRAGLKQLQYALAAYRGEHASDGKRFAFPAATAWAPAQSCCKAGQTQCPVDPKAFAAPGWKALSFSVDGPSRFAYRLQSTGRGPTAKYLIQARADLGCDGHQTGLQQHGSIDANGNLVVDEPSSF